MQTLNSVQERQTQYTQACLVEFHEVQTKPKRIMQCKPQTQSPQAFFVGSCSMQNKNPKEHCNANPKLNARAANPKLNHSGLGCGKRERERERELPTSSSLSLQQQFGVFLDYFIFAMYTSIGSVCVVCPVPFLQQLNCCSKNSLSFSLTTSSCCFLLPGRKRSWPVSALRTRISRFPRFLSDFALQKSPDVPVASPGNGKASGLVEVRASSGVRGKKNDEDDADDVYVRSFSGNERDGDRFSRGIMAGETRSTSGEKREERISDRSFRSSGSSFQPASSSGERRPRPRPPSQGERKKPWPGKDEPPRRASERRGEPQRESREEFRGRNAGAPRSTSSEADARRDRRGGENDNRRRGRETRSSEVPRKGERGGEGEENEGLEGVEEWWKQDPKLERKRKKEPAVAEQVQFATPMNKQPRIAILGGGMSGLVCALTLEELGISSTVFDTVCVPQQTFLP